MPGLIRRLLDDHFSDEKIVDSVSPRVKELYQQSIGNLGAQDRELENCFLEALAAVRIRRFRKRCRRFLSG